jgi:pyruvate carboxylase
VAYRFLQECPWQRLRDLRARMPNLMTQMLLRASNGVGYTNYPDNVVEAFVGQAASSGVDLFRVFDSLNWVENMRVAMDAVVATGKICEGAICYTGDILDPDRAKYDLKYYVAMGKALRDAGAHILGVKDMAGLLKPAAARTLIRALKEEVGLPVHFHTHDTSGVAAARRSSRRPRRGRTRSMRRWTRCRGGPRSPASAPSSRRSGNRAGYGARHRLDPHDLGLLGGGTGAVRRLRGGPERAPASEVYLHEMPGGQFTNLKAQARSLGLAERWAEVARTYADVNRMFGDIVKVTPSSKVVGDMALMMVSQGLTREQVEDPEFEMAFPDSVVDMLKGNLGQPPGGFPPALVRKALKGAEPLTVRPGSVMPPADLEEKRRALQAAFPEEQLRQRGFLRIPDLSQGLLGLHDAQRRLRPGPHPADARLLLRHGTGTRKSPIEIDPGKILELRLQAVGETNAEGDVRVFFELNGQPRTVRVPDRKAQALDAEAAEGRGRQPRPCRGADAGRGGEPVAVSEGQAVKSGDLILTIEAMKMETGLYADRPGRESPQSMPAPAPRSTPRTCWWSWHRSERRRRLRAQGRRPRSGADGRGSVA